ncbi:hypothetical protein E2C01_043242 [Portunus trituberculatus]|uniref:Uncharacterized protein n=1 Tax=Portunus trituberculatus TaxID=210409 RepID=A0A5B7FPR8_PORTR|nr:hypothetical protein [Portunus trituberculatus]
MASTSATAGTSGGKDNGGGSKDESGQGIWVEKPIISHLPQQDKDQQHVKLEAVGYAAPPNAPCGQPLIQQGAYIIHIGFPVTVPQKH